MLKKRKMKIPEDSTEIKIDPELFRYIQTQGGITFHEPNYIKTGDGYVKIVHVYKLPDQINDFWMQSITGLEDCISTIDISTVSKFDAQKSLNRSMEEQRMREKYAQDFEEAYDAQKRQSQLQSMYDDVKSMGEVIKLVHFRIFVSDRSLVGVEVKCGKIMKKLEADEFLSSVMLNEGKQEWMSLFRTYTEQMKERFPLKGLPLTTEQLAGGYPFQFSSLDDKDGSLLGFTSCGGVVVFNEFLKTKKRLHYNSLAIGDMGSGKSTLLKKRFRARAERGDFIRCFDIDDGFSELTKEFGGRIIRCDGSNGILNPLEILRGGDDEGTNYARHISKVITFYQCLTRAKEDELKQMQKLLRIFYARWCLVPDGGRRITGLPASRYPTFSDFHRIVGEIMEEKKAETLTATDIDQMLLADEIRIIKAIYENLAMVISDYGAIFDGHTTVDNISDEKIVTFDIKSIKDMGDVFVAQLFNMVYYCWDNCVSVGSVMKKMYEDGVLSFSEVTRIFIIIDESHTWVNTMYPLILDQILVIMREARKYFSGILMASQQLSDFFMGEVNESSREKMNKIFSLTQYKFIMKQGSSVLPFMDKAFGKTLSPWQRDKIPNLEQGQCILSIAGDRNIFFKIWLSKDYEEPLFKGGA